MILDGVWPARLLALAAGAATVLAFAPFHQGWLATLTFTLLLILWRRTAPGRAFALGWAFGLGLFGVGLFWLRHSIETFGGMNPPLAVAATLALAAFLALYPALTGWLACRWLPPGNLRLPALAALWVIFEGLRGRLFTGLSWLQLGYAQLDTPLAGYLPLGGVLLAGLAVTVSAALLARGRSWWLLMLPLLWGGGWWLQQQSWTRPAAPPLAVALVQPDIPQAIKWEPEQFQPTLEILQRLGDQAPEAQVVIWPETAVPAFADQVENAVLTPLDQRFRRRGRTLLLGIPAREADGRYFNAALALGADGRQRYDKRHLVPFGEYMPLRSLLAPLARALAIPMSNFSAGQGRPLLILGGQPAGLSICYEDSFGYEVAAALPEATWLVNLSNDAWFGDSLGPRQHLQMAQARALESGRPMARATNTGISALIDHHGRILARLDLDRQGVLRGSLVPQTGLTPWGRWGLAPLGGALGLILLVTALMRMGLPVAPRVRGR